MHNISDTERLENQLHFVKPTIRKGLELLFHDLTPQELLLYVLYNVFEWSPEKIRWRLQESCMLSDKQIRRFAGRGANKRKNLNYFKIIYLKYLKQVTKKQKKKKPLK